MNDEMWKTIEKFPSYEISNQGRVKSFKKHNGTNERILTPGKDKNGYLKVILYKNKKPCTKLIHRLVLEAFKPNKDLNKTQCNHLDGNKENNYVENLEWCTPSENTKHAYEIGLRNNKGENHYLFGKHPSEESKRKQSEKMKGENGPNSTLTEKDVIEIWKDLNEGILTQKQIGEKFGVCSVTISNIKTGRTWSHIKLENNE